eukprot:TRINITY_DN5578_c0_g1_i2.p1 TRINITY_DN5578_c0_g1~~TRINITY_DN5578_c0_g1_i2.p1  ORF type:complete len:227 (-),score=46.41 TRINITY_DN5578_c0_g1_i2:86-682(-)
MTQFCEFMKSECSQKFFQVEELSRDYFLVEDWKRCCDMFLTKYDPNEHRQWPLFCPLDPRIEVLVLMGMDTLINGCSYYNVICSDNIVPDNIDRWLLDITKYDPNVFYADGILEISLEHCMTRFCFVSLDMLEYLSWVSDTLIIKWGDEREIDIRILQRFTGVIITDSPPEEEWPPEGLDPDDFDNEDVYVGIFSSIS